MSERNVPAMDRPSLAFARFLDSMVVEDGMYAERPALVLNCTLCSDTVCAVEDGDTLRVLLNTALAHECGA